MRIIVYALLAAGLLFAACGDGDDGSAGFDATARPRPTSTAQPLSDGNPPGIPVLSGEIVATASGLRYIDEQPGVGPSPSPR